MSMTEHNLRPRRVAHIPPQAMGNGNHHSVREGVLIRQTKHAARVLFGEGEEVVHPRDLIDLSETGGDE